MLHSIKRYWLVLTLLLTGSQSLFGFALLGPFNETFQVNTIGYNLAEGNDESFGNGNSDVGAPKNLGQGYRWNTPTVYYAADGTWVKFFGTNGLAEMDKAFATFNSLSNVSSYSPTLSEWPFEASRANSTAAALSLLDLKSEIVGEMVEQLGLAQPDRWAWCLRLRVALAPLPCPNFDYAVIERNYDPVTQNYTPYVNNTLWGYTIAELCTLNPNSFAPLLADTVRYTADPTTANTAVAAGLLGDGSFYTGFTRDDIGGLRYLYAATNIFEEVEPPGSLLEVTNAPTVLTISNLAVLQQLSLTLPEAQLQAIFPNLIITSETTFESNVLVTNVTFELVNPPPFSPAGTAAAIEPVMTVTPGFQQFFIHTFGNIVTNTVVSTGVTVTNIVTGGAAPFAPSGSGLTLGPGGFSTKPAFFTNQGFFIVPANLCGGFQFLTNPTPILTVSSNVTFIPVLQGGSLNGSTIQSETVVTFFTNTSFVVLPISCAPAAPILKEGIEKINFVRVDFDSLIGATWGGPVTNVYTKVAVSNGAPVIQTFQRVVTAPDILLTTADLVAPAANGIFYNPFARSTPNFDQSQKPGNAAGPGTIDPSVTLTFNNVGPVFDNEGPFFQGGISISSTSSSGTSTQQATVTPDASSTLQFQWGTFDGTTNAPILYPDTASLAGLNAQIFFQITTVSLNYSVSSNFNVTLQASGGSPPYIWPTNGLLLPAGLTLTTNGVLSGVIPGATSNSPPISFGVEAMDAGARITQAQLIIVFGP